MKCFGQNGATPDMHVAGASVNDSGLISGDAFRSQFFDRRILQPRFPLERKVDVSLSHTRPVVPSRGGALLLHLEQHTRVLALSHVLVRRGRRSHVERMSGRVKRKGSICPTAGSPCPSNAPIPRLLSHKGLHLRPRWLAIDSALITASRRKHREAITDLALT